MPKDGETKIVSHFAFFPKCCQLRDVDTEKKMDEFVYVWLERYYTKERHCANGFYWLGKRQCFVWNK